MYPDFSFIVISDDRNRAYPDHCNQYPPSTCANLWVITSLMMMKENVPKIQNGCTCMDTCKYFVTGNFCGCFIFVFSAIGRELTLKCQENIHRCHQNTISTIHKLYLPLLTAKLTHYTVENTNRFSCFIFHRTDQKIYNYKNVSILIKRFVQTLHG